jgi:hypothetical protein
LGQAAYEALLAGAIAAGEKPPVRRRTASAPGCGKREKREKPVEIRFSLPDPWSRQMFIALCRYGLRPYRYPRMHRQSVMLRAPHKFLDKILWPEFQEINAALTEYLAQVTDSVIREAVYKDTGDAEEVAEPEKLGR